MMSLVAEGRAGPQALCCCSVLLLLLLPCPRWWQVYYGTWNNQAVAIKVLNTQAADSAKLMAEFLREVTTMTRLPEHPHVLRLLGCAPPPHLALVTQ